jgi:RNA polymerase sigma factor (TIGR02999 family)
MHPALVRDYPSPMEQSLNARSDDEDRAAKSKLTPPAVHPLVEKLYKELKQIAQQRLGSPAGNPTLGPTVLVHEVAFRLSREAVGEADPAGFLRLASRAMQHIVIDHARYKHAKVRGGGRKRESFDEDLLPAMTRAAPEQLAAVGLAIDEFAGRSAEAERAAEFFRLHFFAGLTYEQIATSCGTSQATVRRGCEYARASMRRILTQGELDHGPPDRV